MYSDNFFSSFAGVGSINQTFQTSLFDVDLLNVGHQPLYFDQLATIYDRYIVYGFKYQLIITSDSDKAVIVNVQKHNNSTMDTSTTLAAERWQDKQYQIVANKITYINGYVNTVKLHGIKKANIEDFEFTASTAGNPLRLAFLKILMQNPTTSPINLTTQVRLLFYAKMYNLKMIAGS